MKNIDILKLRKAIELTLDNINISNYEIADELGVHEKTIRRWKAHPAWQEEQEKIEEFRKDIVQEALKNMKKEKQDEFLQKLEDSQKKLETLLEGMTYNAGISLKIANKAYAEASNKKSQIDASTTAMRAGVHIHSDNSMKAVRTIMLMNEQLFQLTDVHRSLKEIIETTRKAEITQSENDEYIVETEEE